MFNRYSDYLNSGFSDDYWSDQGIDFAICFINDFLDDDWGHLLAECRSERTSDAWKIRCTETLGNSETRQSLDVLKSFLISENDELILASLDSINSSCCPGFLSNDEVDEVIKVADALPASGRVADFVTRSLRTKLQNIRINE